MVTGKPNSKKARDTKSASGRAKAMEFRKAGYQYREISDALGVPISTVGRWVKEGMDQWRKQAAKYAEDIVLMEEKRLDRMLAGVWSRAKAGDDAAVDRVIKIMERRAKLLGLDKPSKVAPTNPDGSAPYDGAGLSALLASVSIEEKPQPDFDAED